MTSREVAAFILGFAFMPAIRLIVYGCVEVAAWFWFQVLDK